MGELWIRGVSKRFGRVLALDEVDIRVNNQEFFVLFGPTGAGKTTLLNIVAGIHVPDQGQVYLNGRSIDHLEPNERDVAMVFENYALYPHLNVFENIASPLFSPRYRKSNVEAKEEVLRVARLLDIFSLLDRYPAELSNGQRQRVALGRALVRRPEVFLMDEPLVHLDAKLRHQMRAELKEIQNKSLDTTTIYVTHDYREALSLGDRIAVINRGRIEQVGSPEEVYHRPASEFVARAFGDPEMNILEAELVEDAGRLHLNLFGKPGHFPVPDEVRKAMLKHSSSSVKVGFRPKHIRFYPEDPEGNHVAARVYSFEPLGETAVLIAEAGDRRIRLLASSEHAWKIDQPVHLEFDMNRALFFDASSGKLLAPSGERKEDVVWRN
ncbi:carbohydrate ABC transporter ATP-binding protein (CUT1 family) [Planifilum fimeticola]|uniref:Carbohydrate ABC transporter ATP-binding protein (CUT1 family) n=1 Tax=Planifilum fimeticola TaxID=201975 RepID=A0A2T0LGF7_9BACL|nr:ABC transporter ATP-binding protein [Planifilum fimeticola]PRX41345.1 carbohydrate ABC transporter ATP-binding protein (CUT1 family) [Planifilum fimeticola]